MRKYLISALAALALTACGSDGPSEAELKVKEDLRVMELTWSMGTETVHKNLCAMVDKEGADAVVELLRKNGSDWDIPKAQEAAFYKSKCFFYD